MNPKIILVTGSMKPKKEELDSADIIIGTHALIANKIKFSDVGLVVIDEQHKFGVSQRGVLRQKSDQPHLLTMTATPIPRTVSLTLYRQLDISLLDQLPPGRIQVKTFLVPDLKRKSAYQWIKSQIDKYNTQIFIVCPLIEESTLETLKTIKAVKAEYENLKKIFSEYSLGLLHGKLKSAQKNEVISQFIDRKYHILVTTPVVEVGVDIPNANIIIIEASHRYGLAQLHQLRGRVGRSNKQAYCLLFTDRPGLSLINRLKTFAKTNDGFKLAELDLKNRGTGQIYGTAQHGRMDFKITDISDIKLIADVSQACQYFLDHNFRIFDFPLLQYGLDQLKTNQITRD